MRGSAQPRPLDVWQCCPARLRLGQDCHAEPDPV